MARRWHRWPVRRFGFWYFARHAGRGAAAGAGVSSGLPNGRCRRAALRPRWAGFAVVSQLGIHVLSVDFEAYEIIPVYMYGALDNASAMSADGRERRRSMLSVSAGAR